MHRPGITAAIVGARNPAQASENAAAAALQLTPSGAGTDSPGVAPRAFCHNIQMFPKISGKPEA